MKQPKCPCGRIIYPTYKNIHIAGVGDVLGCPYYMAKCAVCMAKQLVKEWTERCRILFTK